MVHYKTGYNWFLIKNNLIKAKFQLWDNLVNMLEFKMVSKFPQNFISSENNYDMLLGWVVAVHLGISSISVPMPSYCGITP